MVKQWAPIYLNKNQKFEFTDELSNGKIPAIVLKKAFSLKTCKKITQKILNSNYITDGPGIDKKIGESLNSYLNQKETYFKKTELTDTKLENYFDTIDDPRIVMQKLLSIIFQKKISVAKENNLLDSSKIKLDLLWCSNQKKTFWPPCGDLGHYGLYLAKNVSGDL